METITKTRGRSEQGVTPSLLTRIDSRTLFGEQRKLAIAHGDQVYRLQITRLGKLILTK